MSSAVQRKGNRLSGTIVFARNFFKHPRMLGSIIPSSRFLVNRVLDRVRWDEAKVIVEYGPGVGVFTTEILRRMRRDAVLLVVETNREFVDHLQATLPDPRMHVIHGSAADVAEMLHQQHFEHADYIISGIPFTTLPANVRSAILVATRAVLRPGGRMLAFQFSPAVLADLRKVFGRVDVSFEPLNILPALVLDCVRSVDAA